MKRSGTVAQFTALYCTRERQTVSRDRNEVSYHRPPRRRQRRAARTARTAATGST
jgi:hypothetical protein